MLRNGLLKIDLNKNAKYYSWIQIMIKWHLDDWCLFNTGQWHVCYICAQFWDVHTCFSSHPVSVKAVSVDRLWKGEQNFKWRQNAECCTWIWDQLFNTKNVTEGQRARYTTCEKCCTDVIVNKKMRKSSEQMEKLLFGYLINPIPVTLKLV